MLRVETFVPEIYVKKSRDFQMYCKVLELVANDVKYNADTITDIFDPFKCNNRMLELLCTLYNYQPRRDISDHDLRLILSNYNYLIMHKGSKKGIEAAISLAIKLTGKHLSWSYSLVTKDNSNNPVYTLYVTIGGSYDRAYLHEFLDLVLPVGFIVDDAIAESYKKDTEVATVISSSSGSESASDASSVIDVSTVTTDIKQSIDRTEVLE